jgi:Flp pilus assembly protein TadD
MFSASTAMAHPEDESLPDSAAVMEYQIVLSMTPDDCKTRNRLAAVYYRMGRIDEAEREYRKVLEKDAANRDAMEGLRLTSMRRGK